MLSNINQNRARKLFCTVLVAGVGKEAENLAKKEKRGIWRSKFDRPEDWRRKNK